MTAINAARNDQIQRVINIAMGASTVSIMLTVPALRITSYNVCYTKLLRKPHIAWLQYRVYHPLFIAYAYNGGIGFTKRYLLSGMFNPGPYEPFLSMELMRTTETREYGKIVLTNYVIYKHT